MIPKARHTARYGYSTPMLLPPSLQALGPLSFTAQDFATLDAWLAEEGWPHERMDVAMLEGYLVALIAWPIELAPGAWLPPIWGIRGWKVAAKIATSESYNRFVGLIVGMFQELERRIGTIPSERTFVLGPKAPYLSGQYFAGAAWATGFMVALHENSAGLGSRSVAVRSAVEDIARYASTRSSTPTELPRVAAALTSALMTIMAERPARGPRALVAMNKAAPAKPSVSEAAG